MSISPTPSFGTGDDCVSIGHWHHQHSHLRCHLWPRTRHQELTNGARIKTYHASPSLEASGIIYKDIIVTDVQNPIIIDQHYDSKKNHEESKVKISDVHFINIKGTTVSKIPVALNCSETVPCEGVELVDIDLTPSGSVGTLTSACANAKFVSKGKPIPPGCE
ncbi:Pectin lyase-like superfamily protein [Forsythia ovata]|uniref:Pectin lyase-like superfamily protein n=1 Tax=Forsythia ovata TaxID=205694 RepID=A0ABD1T4N0_9LAMI